MKTIYLFCLVSICTFQIAYAEDSASVLEGADKLQGVPVAASSFNVGQQGSPPKEEQNKAEVAANPEPSSTTGVTANSAVAPGGKAETAGVKRYGTVTRLHYRYTVNGESGVALGHFHLFPNSALVAATIEAYTERRSRDPFEFSTYNLEINGGRPIFPAHPWGKAFGWVARFQSMTGTDPVVSGGLQWDISRTPGATLPGMQWKSFIQVFAKSRADAGTFDVFHWYEFVLMEQWLFLRGTNAWYMIPGKEDALKLTQDLVIPVHKKLDLYLRHYFQNNSNTDRTRSNGSQFSIGMRYTF